MWIDITRPVENGMPVYPGDPVTEISVFSDERSYGGACVSRISMCSHAGTHMDAPAHYLADGIGALEVPLDILIGPARVHTDAGAYPACERLLLRNARPMDEEMANSLPAEIRLLGVDAMSVGNDAAHRILLRRGVIMIEGLTMSAVADGEWELVCLPLSVNGDGAPARAAVRRSWEG